LFLMVLGVIIGPVLGIIQPEAVNTTYYYTNWNLYLLK